MRTEFESGFSQSTRLSPGHAAASVELLGLVGNECGRNKHCGSKAEFVQQWSRCCVKVTKAIVEGKHHYFLRRRLFLPKPLESARQRHGPVTTRAQQPEVPRK